MKRIFRLPSFLALLFSISLPAGAQECPDCAWISELPIEIGADPAPALERLAQTAPVLPRIRAAPCEVLDERSGTYFVAREIAALEARAFADAEGLARAQQTCPATAPLPPSRQARICDALSAAKRTARGLDAAADALIKANNLVAFYGYEGLTYVETDTLAKLLANLLLLKNEDKAHAGQVNSGLIPVWPHNNTQGAWDMGVHPALASGYQPVESPGLNAAAVYEAAQSGAIKALYVMGADPVGDGRLPDRGQLDFLIVQELFLTETAKLAAVVLPAQSWAEREGTYTSGERRVQRYYQAIPPLGECRPDWQIVAQIGERLDMAKPAIAASLLFRDLAKVVPQYKRMDYRSLARVEEQWPDVGGEDVYFGGTSYRNEAGLGQQWAAAAETDEVGLFEVAAGDTAVAANLPLVHIAKLYTPGTLINHTPMLADRLAVPTLHLHAGDAEKINAQDGDERVVVVNGRKISARVSVNGRAPAGLALISGVPWFPGTVEFNVTDS